MPDIEWTDVLIARLTTLWNEGHTASQISTELGVSKNSVIGKVHRLGLDARPSPILRNRTPKPAPVKRAPRQTLALPVVQALPTPVPVAVIELVEVELPPVQVDMLPSVAAPPRAAVRGESECRYPVGLPRTPGFRFCEAPCPAGQSYCAAHHAVCHPARRAPVPA